MELGKRNETFAKISELYKKNERYAPAAFFVAGFLFDVLTLSRIDDAFTIAQQAIYLGLIAVFLYYELLDSQAPLMIPERLKRIWDARILIVHFVFGSLLSLYTLFYFKSSSFVSSFVFLLLLTTVMIANEFTRFQKMGPTVRFTVFVLCLSSYMAYLVPIIYGSVGLIPFLLSLVLSASLVGAMYLRLQRKLQAHPHPRPFKWGLAMVCAFLLLYVLKLIPPVPLSAQYIGIYHQIEKSQGQYRLLYDRPLWKFWQNGAQTFLAKPGDRIYVFARVFSPTRFRDQIRVRWLFKDPRLGWQSSDAIPIEITGGREEGFRGFAYKQNYTPGDWRVQLETTDGREIGRISFTIVPDSSQDEHRFAEDLF